MMDDTAVQLTAGWAWAPWVAAAACAAGIALLLLATWRAEREQRLQQARIGTLEEQLAEALRGQIELHEQCAELRQQGSALRLRQERMEKRAPDARRIDHAVRLVQNGHARADMLRDLGLSTGEAELLLRLHHNADAPSVTADVAEPAASASQADGLARALSAAAGA